MPIAATRSKGLRKFIPQPDRYAERYGRFTLTSRDVQMLESVHRYRYLEARHIHALIKGSDQQITRRLQGLFHNGYVGRYGRRERMRVNLGSGAPLIAYGLELKGARTLERIYANAAAGDGTAPTPVRWKKEYTRRTEWFLEHHLMVSSFRCNLELALRQAPDTDLVFWEQSKEAWFQVAIPGERNRLIRVAPDAQFALCQGEQVRHFFLEADRGTEEHRRIVAKFIAYWWYLQEERFMAGTNRGRPRVNVLFITTGEKRRRSLEETLRQMPKPNRANHGGKGVFSFIREDEYRLDDPSGFWVRVLPQMRETPATVHQNTPTTPNQIPGSVAEDVLHRTPSGF